MSAATLRRPADTTMLTSIQYRVLKAIAPHEPSYFTGPSTYVGKSKLRVLLGDDAVERLRGRTVVDFGCGVGAESVEMAKAGAQVIGVEIQEEGLRQARANAAAAGVADRCRFTAALEGETADVVVSIDSFEHFDDPLGALRTMYGLLRPGGVLLASFGPPWYHPYGGHMFSVFPWAHVVFAEPALTRWRADLRSDGARRFSEVAGGLNQMTIRRFERLIAQTPFRIEHFEAVPIRKLRRLHNRLTRELFTTIVRCRLVKPAE